MGRMIFAKPVNQKGQQKTKNTHHMTKVGKELDKFFPILHWRCFEDGAFGRRSFSFGERILSDPVLYGKGDIYDPPLNRFWKMFLLVSDCFLKRGFSCLFILLCIVGFLSNRSMELFFLVASPQLHSDLSCIFPDSDMRHVFKNGML